MEETTNRSQSPYTQSDYGQQQGINQQTQVDQTNLTDVTQNQESALINSRPMEETIKLLKITWWIFVLTLEEKYSKFLLQSPQLSQEEINEGNNAYILWKNGNNPLAMFPLPNLKPTLDLNSGRPGSIERYSINSFDTIMQRMYQQWNNTHKIVGTLDTNSDSSYPLEGLVMREVDALQISKLRKEIEELKIEITEDKMKLRSMQSDLVNIAKTEIASKNKQLFQKEELLNKLNKRGIPRIKIEIEELREKVEQIRNELKQTNDGDNISHLQYLFHNLFLLQRSMEKLIAREKRVIKQQQNALESEQDPKSMVKPEQHAFLTGKHSLLEKEIKEINAELCCIDIEIKQLTNVQKGIKNTPSVPKSTTQELPPIEDVSEPEKKRDGS
jgi:hypothetical protein